MTNQSDINTLLMNGWPSLHEYEMAAQEGKLIVGQIETTNVCNLRCLYCYRDVEAKGRHFQLENEISLQETLEVIDAMCELGAQAIHVPGAGEPLLDRHFDAIITRIARQGAVPLVYTNGSIMDDDRLQLLNKTDASLIVKVDSFKPELQDALTSCDGYTQQRQRTLQKLIDAGFTKPSADATYQTRLGLGTVVCTDNRDDAFEVLRYCRIKNCVPMIKQFLPLGRGKSISHKQLSMPEWLDLSSKASDVDSAVFGVTYSRLFPFMGGAPCTACGPASMYVNIEGNIYDCNGQQHSFGNIKDAESVSTAIAHAFSAIRSLPLTRGSCPARIALFDNFAS